MNGSKTSEVEYVKRLRNKFLAEIDLDETDEMPDAEAVRHCCRVCSCMGLLHECTSSSPVSPELGLGNVRPNGFGCIGKLEQRGMCDASVFLGAGGGMPRARANSWGAG